MRAPEGPVHSLATLNTICAEPAVPRTTTPPPAAVRARCVQQIHMEWHSAKAVPVR
jgi:hypothetical protein